MAFVGVAVLGFFATGTGVHATHATLESAPKVLALFPVNVAHNLVHLLFGVWGLIAARRQRSAMVYASVSGAAYLLLAVRGMLAPTRFGLVPIGGYDILLHLALAVALIGCVLWQDFREPKPERSPAT